MTTLTKVKIADAVTESIGTDRAQSLHLIDSLLDIIKGNFIAGEDLLVSGFGKFEVKDKKSRFGRNPVTGNRMTLPGRKVVVFHPSPMLREKINGQDR